MSLVFKYPDNAAFGQFISKEKIYANAAPSYSLRKLFIAQVEKIVWEYKLAPETININATENALEIQIFSIVLKTKEMNFEVLRCIDKAIPLPLIFELRYNDEFKIVAAYKRVSDTDHSKLFVGEYFATPWLPSDTPREPLPTVFDLENLYGHLLQALIPYPIRNGESLRTFIERIETAALKKKKLEKLDAQINRELQFSRKAEMNKEYLKLKKEYNELIS